MKLSGNRIAVLALSFSLCASVGYSQVWIIGVSVPFVVTDKDGRHIENLSENDFMIYDNGKPQKITYFKESLNAPLKIALLLDRSQSVAAQFPLLQQASQQFLHSIMRPGVDRACLVAFDSHVYLLQDWTDDVERVTGRIGQLTPAGGTALFDAIYKTARDKLWPDPDDPATRILILVTDGEDTTSHASFKQVIDMVQQSGVIVYVVGVKTEDSLNPRELQGKEIFAKLRDISGGEVLYPRREQDGLGALFKRIEEGARNQYIVGFTAYTAPDGEFHTVSVATTRKGFVIHARKKGYRFAKPNPLAQ